MHMKNIVIREATAKDIPTVVDFYMRMDHPGQKDWIEIMMDGRHPYVDAANFIVAEDMTNGKLVASIIYMPWTFSYCGCMVEAVRLEEVFCEPAYQNQGIAKAILQRIADISVQRGYLFECVYGTNAVYPRLGYTYGLPNEEEGYSYIIKEEAVDDEFYIEEASDDDISAIAKLYETNYTRNLLTTYIGSKELYYMKNVYVEGNFYLIKAADGRICGFFHTQLPEKRIYMMELDETVSYFQIRPYLTDFYRQLGLDRIHIKLGKTHPVYTVFKGFYHQKLLSELGFVKVRDLPKMLMAISGILSGRMAQSSYAYYTGTFTMAMHNKNEAYRFDWKDGTLLSVTPVEQEHGEIDIERDRFIKLLFGRVSPEDMQEAFSMFYFQNSDLRNIIEILFPQMQSHVVSIN